MGLPHPLLHGDAGPTLDELIEENGVLARALAAAQRRSSRWVQSQAQRIDAQQVEIVRLRALLIARDTTIAVLQEEIDALRRAQPVVDQPRGTAASRRRV